MSFWCWLRHPISKTERAELASDGIDPNQGGARDGAAGRGGGAGVSRLSLPCSPPAPSSPSAAIGRSRRDRGLLGSRGGRPRRPPPAGATTPAIAPTPSPAAVDPAELELPLQGIAARPGFVTADDGLQPLRTWSTCRARRSRLVAGALLARAGPVSEQVASAALVTSSPGTRRSSARPAGRGEKIREMMCRFGARVPIRGVVVRTRTPSARSLTEC